MLRRTIGFILTIVLVYVAGYQSAWHRDIRDRVINDPWESFGLLLVVILGIGLVVIFAIKHNPAAVFVGIAVGVIAALWAVDLFEGIEWSTLAWFGATLVGLVLLWALTVLDRTPNWRTHPRARPVSPTS